MVQSKTVTPAQKPDDTKRQYAWHRHPALIAAIPAVFTLIGGVLTVGLGQADVLPNAINPAPPPVTVLATSTVTSTATSTVTETITETPTPEPSQPSDPGSTSTPPVVPSGSVAITIEVGRSGKIGPTEYRAGSIPTAVATVYDASGAYLASGCYPTWVLKRGTTVLKTSRAGRCDSTFYFDRTSLEVRGVYHLTVSVVTDGGAKGTKTADFTVT